MFKFRFVPCILIVCLLLTDCGNCLNISKKIINGFESTEVSEYTVEVVARFENELLSWGGGTLLAPNVVLTDATIIVGYTEHTVRFGSWTWGGLYEVEVAEAVPHPNYERETQLHDIGLLRLVQAVDSSK